MAEPLVPEGSRQPSVRELLAVQLTSGVGAVIYRRLLEAFGSVQGILAAPPGRLEEVEGVGPKRASGLASGRGLDLADAEMSRCADLGISLLPWTDGAYPPGLREIYDPPLVLFCRGDLRPEDALALGVVGARNCSHYGRSQAERFGRELAATGFTVVSGLARGVDSAAHRGALDAGGRTLAVLGCGLGQVYPPENSELARSVSASGALLSELPADAPPSRENFPRRNRLISGLSLGVLVVEGSRRSGSLITARCALEQGREVFALPGKVDNRLASGPNSLIKGAGAKLVESTSDVLEELGPVADELAGIAGAGCGAGESGRRGGARARTSGLNSRERLVLDRLQSDPLQIDSIIDSSGLPPAEVAGILMVLEIRRLARRLPGGRYVSLVN
jgi:DNA processing protein